MPTFSSVTVIVSSLPSTTVRWTSSTPLASTSCRAAERTRPSETDWIRGRAATAFGTPSIAASVIALATSAWASASSRMLIDRFANERESNRVSST